MINYSEMKDEELVDLSNSDERALDAILLRYKKAVVNIARQYYIIGGEESDLIQEGTLGLFKAVKNYNGKAAFKNFALTCIKNSIITAVKRDNRLKHRPLKFSVSISGEDGDDEDKNPAFVDAAANPEEKYIDSERETELKEKIKDALSDFEYRVLFLSLAGFSYADIAEREKKSVKSVDNAVQRVRKKIKSIEL